MKPPLYVRHPALRDLMPLFFLAGAVLLLVGIYYGIDAIDLRRESTREAQPQFYADVPQVERQCPPLTPAIRAALADRFISRTEARDLSQRLQDMSHAYRDAVDMRAAKAKLGIPVSGPLPPSCDARMDVDSTIDLFYAP
jgi:hypothetical protein